MVRIFCFVAAMMVMSWASTVAAQADDARARLHFDAGTSYFEQARYQDALDEWQEAYRLSGRALLLLNIANAQERMGDPGEAADTLERYLHSGEDEAETNRATLEIRIQNLRQLAEDRDDTVEESSPPDERTTEEPVEETPPPEVPPEALEVDPDEGGGETSEGRRWYRSWWFWTIMGVVVAGGVTAAVVVPITSSPDADWYIDLP